MTDQAAKAKRIEAAAERALQEAASRRETAAAQPEDRPKEIGGRDGAEPTRYGDWELKGVAVDF